MRAARETTAAFVAWSDWRRFYQQAVVQLRITDQPIAELNRNGFDKSRKEAGLHECRAPLKVALPASTGATAAGLSRGCSGKAVGG